MLPGSGKVKDRNLIVEYTGEDPDDFEGFLVNSLDYMVQDQSVNNSWKNLAGGLYDNFNNRKPYRQSVGGFTNDIHHRLKLLVRRRFKARSTFSQKSWKRLLLRMVVIPST